MSKRPTMNRSAATTLLGTLLLVLLIPACDDAGRAAPPTGPSGVAPTGPSFTAGSGSTPIEFGPGGTIARGTFAEGFHVKRKTGKWEINLKAKDPTDVAVRSFAYEPGAYTGWHRHPGPVLIQVLEGTVTFYESDDPHCTPIVVGAGQGYLDTGEHAHIGRNETNQPARDLVVFFAPPGTPLRIDAPAPGNCPF